MDPSQQLSSSRRERAVLVGVVFRGAKTWQVRDSLEELARLASTAGAEVCGEIVCRLQRPYAGYFISRRKASEIADVVMERKIDIAIFDEELTPAQGRNLENVVGARVVDRTQVILDIFAQHASSHAGRVQVELAQIEYLLPRLRRMWTHLERQRGGIGLRGGPGEQQIEVDRRRLKDRIVRLRHELEVVRRHRSQIRTSRRRHGWASICLVGYTNAGKSTLMNAITGAGVKAKNQLFVTLDPTTRRMNLPGRQAALLTDTVGFIQKLPHHLVEAFKATLEEVVEADLLIHVVDCTHPRVEDQINAVLETLGELGATSKPVLTALNKIDLPEGRVAARRLYSSLPDTVMVSALTGEGVGQLMNLLADHLGSRQERICLDVPMSRPDVIATIRRVGNIHEAHSTADEMLFDVHMPRALIGRCRRFVIDRRTFESMQKKNTNGV